MTATDSRTRSRRATCCRGPPRRSSRSTAPGGCAAGGRARRGGRVHRAGTRADPRAGGALPRGLPPLLGARRRAGAGPPSRPWPCRRAGLGPRWARAPRIALRWLLYAAAGQRGGATVGPWLVLVLLACGAVELTVRRRAAARRVVRRAPRRRAPAAWLARVGGVQGRRALLRRRLRHRPPDAERRRQPLPLDDERPVPQRGRARPDHAGAGRADGRRRRLRGRGRRRRPARLAGRVPSVLLVHPARRRRFDRLLANERPRLPRRRRPAAIGAIVGSAVPLALALGQPWQFGVLAGAAVLLLGSAAAS